MNLFDLMATLGLDSSAYEKGLGDAEGKANSFGSKLRSGLSTAAKAAGVALTAATTAAVGFGMAAVKTGENFDKSMSQVVATMGFTVEELNDDTSEAAQTMKALRDFAQEMGATTVFSASQAADALNYMALAGYDAETSMQMLPNVLNLAASGAMELATASDMITDAQSALGLTLDETSIMVDQMAKTASKSNTSVSQLGEALLTIGGTAQFMSGGTERLNTVLGILADNGIKGSEAGTHLRNMLMKLSSPTKEGADAIEMLGLQVFDAEGHMRDMQDIIEDLGVAMADMTDEQKIQTISALFNARDVAAVQALLGTTTERWNELGAAIVDSEGAAQAMADVQLDNLAGDITLLKSAWEGVQIAVSDNLTPSVRDFVQFASGGLSKLTSAIRGEGGFEAVMETLGDIISDGIKLIISKLPDMVKAGSRLLRSLIQGIGANAGMISQAAIDIVMVLAEGIMDNPGALLKAARDMIYYFTSVLGDNIQMIIDAGTTILLGFLDTLTSPGAMNDFVDAALWLMENLTQGLVDAIPRLVEAIPVIIDNVITGIQTNLPLILESGIEMLQALLEGIMEAAPTLIEYIPVMLEQIFDIFTQNIPQFVETGMMLLLGLSEGFVDSIPQLLGEILPLIMNFTGEIRNHFGKIVDVGIAILMNLLQGIINALPELLTYIPTIISNITGLINDNFPKVIQAGFSLLGKLLQGIINAVPTLIAEFPKIVKAIIDVITATNWLNVGKQIIQGLINGVGQMAGALWEAVKNVAKGALNAIKSFFGIHSPSTVFRDQVGKMLGIGLAEGIDESAGEAIDSAKDMANDVLNEMQDMDKALSAEFHPEISAVSANGYAGGDLTGRTAGVIINVYGAVGQDVSELAEIVSQKIAFATQQEKFVWA